MTRVAATVIVTFLLSITLTNCNKQKQETEAELKEVKASAINYLANPMFSSKNFLEQITGTKANLEIYNLDEKLLYFTLSSKEDWSVVAAKLSSNPSSIKMASLNKEGILQLNDNTLDKPGTFLFAIPEDDFIVNTDAVIKVPFKNSVTYDISMRELHRFIANEVVIGGYIWHVIEDGRQGGLIKKTCNFGAFVTKSGEPSLERLVDRIVSPGDSKEVMAQKILDFVTKNVPYDQQENQQTSMQVAKKANETLMTQTATCASLATLYASLINQKGIRFKLVYYDTHLTVFVEGDFIQSRSAIYLQLDEKTFSLAETTAKGFQIGGSAPEAGFNFQKDWIMYQDPIAGKIDCRSRVSSRR